jgi:hypothetical protein
MFSTMNKILFFFISLTLLLSSCIELIDDLTIHNDGSGTFKYTINLSASKIKVNSILALDSLDGKKVPSMAEIKAKANSFAANLKTQSGISNVTMSINDADLIIKLSFDFNSIPNFQSGLKAAILSIRDSKQSDDSNQSNELNQNWISWDGKILKRNIPLMSLTISEQLKETDLDLLKTGSYTTICRFDRAIEKAEKSTTKINPSRTASMLKVNTYDLQKNYSLIDNCIYLTPLKNK